MHESFKSDREKELKGIQNGILGVAMANLLEDDIVKGEAVRAWEQKYSRRAKEILDRWGSETLLSIHDNNKYEEAANDLIHELAKE
ncbi:MAG: hypothetical protein KBD16_01350 [Candidatus Pacebacteria bacterium]|nr:hypothetical protein [Candidatus Paceibacterota bacterium]